MRHVLRIRPITGVWTAFFTASLGLRIAAASGPEKQPFVYRAWQTHTMADGLPSDAIRCIRVCDDKVWVGTDGGLALYQGGTWKKWTADDGLPWPVITTIDVQQQTGDVWLGTWGGGLIRFTAGRFDQFTQFDSGLAGDLVFAVAVEGSRVWVATTGGVSSLDTIRDTWELPLPRRADKPQNLIIDLDWSAFHNTLFAAEWCGHLQKFVHEQGRWTLRSAASEHELPEDLRVKDLSVPPPASTAAVAGDSLWEAAQSGLTRLSRGDARAFRKLPEETGARRFVNCLGLRSESEAWLGTNRGVYALVDWETDTWVVYRGRGKEANGSATVIREGRPAELHTLCSTIPADWVSCVAFQGEDVWVGTTSGIARGIGEGRWSGLRSNGSASQPAETVQCPPGGALSQESHRVSPAPSAPQALSIAVFGPITKTIALPGTDPESTRPSSGPDTLAVQIAVEQANAIGGYRGQVPFTLLLGTSGYPRYGWGNPEDDMALLSRQGVLGLVASVEPEWRTTIAAALLTELPLANAANRETADDEYLDPWMFRCPGDDSNGLRQVIDHVVGQSGHGRLALVRTPGAEDRRYRDSWASHARRHIPVASLVAEVTYVPGGDNLKELLATLGKSNADAVLTSADTRVSATILRGMRAAGMHQVFVGSDGIVCDEFIRLAGPDPGSVFAPYPCPHRKNRQAEARFVQSYLAQDSLARLRGTPPPEAFLAYHATGHLLLAINLGGPEKHSIRQALEALDDPGMAVLENGEWRLIKPSCPARGR